MTLRICRPVLPCASCAFLRPFRCGESSSTRRGRQLAQPWTPNPLRCNKPPRSRIPALGRAEVPALIT